MATDFFIQRPVFIQRPEDAQRHIDLLAKGLKKVALAGWVGGAGCAFLTLFVARLLVATSGQPANVPGVHEISGITFIAAFMAAALLVFSTLYFVSGWGLSHQTVWARYTAAGTFIAKILLCVWLGRGSVGGMIVFLLIAGWDFYGLWVLLSKGTAHLFNTSESNQTSSEPASANSKPAAAKPANLVT
jgi:hypothetical protein